MPRIRWRPLVWIAAALVCAACDDDEPAAPTDMSLPDAAPDAAVDATPDPIDMLPPDAALTGTLSAAEPRVEFGLVAVGGAGTADLLLRNAGPGPVTVTAFEGLEPPFSTNRSLPLTVPPEAERTVVLTFAPEAVGPAEATITVAADGAGPPVEVTLAGEAALPEGELVGDGLDFGTVAPGEPAADFLEIRNTSPALPLDVYEVVGVEPPFAIPQGQVPVTADAGQSARVLVQFEPEGDGEWSIPVTVRTAAGDFEATLSGRALTPGELVLTGVEPGWAPVDEPRRIVVHGGPFAAAPDGIEIGGVALDALERLDEWRLAGTLPAAGEGEDPALGPVDVRVDLGGGFGVLSGALIRTPPVADGMLLDLADEAPTADPAGNPWTVLGDTLPAASTLTVMPGAVLLFGGGALTVEGAVQAGGPEGPTVFSAAACGGWRGLDIVEGEAAVNLNRVQVECAAPDGPTVRIAGRSPGLSEVAIRAAGGGCVDVQSGALTLVTAELTGCGGPGIALGPEAAVGRLQASRIRGADWPVTGFAHTFGRLPLGAGHDWAGNTHDAIGLGPGFRGDVTLASQPLGVRYRIRDVLRVARGANLRINTGAPLVIDNPIEVEGALTLPGRTRFQAEAGGVITVLAGGTLTAQGMAGDPTVIEARAPEGGPAPGGWGGVSIEPPSTLTGGYLTLRDGGADGPALRLGGLEMPFAGLTVTDSADVGLRIEADAELTGTLFADNPGGVVIAAGAGSITGETADPAPPVRIAEGVDCGAWDTAELLDGAGLAAAVECGGGEGEGEGEPPMMP